MPDTKHDNNLWVWCGRINRLLILIGFAELITAILNKDKDAETRLLAGISGNALNV